ncbi:hypothetical protein WICPIJ_000389 [Wickerhamomyces pijperi]|uniref:Uncharacterized protein n=1 Tax=Wickerhamomyces pijperi TaxID=599730 RepID=A0A9P8QDM4_WICPI|nr:hypothetical protein WICPIJ_000389 [Wickerhamomyces pijperi]
MVPLRKLDWIFISSLVNGAGSLTDLETSRPKLVNNSNSQGFLDRVLGVLQNVQSGIVFRVDWQIGHNHRRTLELLSFDQSGHHLSVRGVNGNGTNICITIVHGIKTDILLGLGSLGVLAVSVVINDNHNLVKRGIGLCDEPVLEQFDQSVDLWSDVVGIWGFQRFRDQFEQLSTTFLGVQVLTIGILWVSFVGILSVELIPES